MKKILLFARDPGGANGIMPLYEPLKEQGYEVLLYGKDVALEKYTQRGLCGLNVMREISELSCSQIRQFLLKVNPDVILTGTSADDMSEKYFWKEGEALGIPTAAILDQWVNYGIRFSKYGVGQMSQYEKEKDISYLPKIIFVMDELAKQEMSMQGLPKERIVVSGHPHLSYLKKQDKRLPKKENARDALILFASEPICKTYGDNSNYWGYTEKTIGSKIVNAIEKMQETTDKRIRLLIRQHPKEEAGSFQNMIEMAREKGIDIDIDQNAQPMTSALEADLILGMSSMFLIEAVLVGKPILSVQIGLKRENPFVLCRNKSLEAVYTQKELPDKILQGLQKQLPNETCIAFLRQQENGIANILCKVREWI